jgi:hypothetical protein
MKGYKQILVQADYTLAGRTVYERTVKEAITEEIEPDTISTFMYDKYCESAVNTSEAFSNCSDSSTDNVNCTHVLSFDRAAVLSNLLVDVGLFPAHAARRPPLASAKPDLLISRLRQPIHIAADLHVRLEGPAVQLIPEMLAQRRLANLKLSSYLGLGDTKGRSTLHKRALGIGRHIFGGHFTFPIAQPRDARALYGKWRSGVPPSSGAVEAGKPDTRRHSANQSLSAVEPVSAPPKRKLENRHQRP